jgi:hypothetical protein
MRGTPRGCPHHRSHLSPPLVHRPEDGDHPGENLIAPSQDPPVRDCVSGTEPAVTRDGEDSVSDLGLVGQSASLPSLYYPEAGDFVLVEDIGGGPVRLVSSKPPQREEPRRDGSEQPVLSDLNHSSMSQRAGRRRLMRQCHRLYRRADEWRVARRLAPALSAAWPRSPVRC